MTSASLAGFPLPYDLSDTITCSSSLFVMSLVGKTVWVVGGVGVVGRGIARGLLKAGATVIVNSRSPERLERIADELQHPERLVTILGSLRPGHAASTVAQTLDQQKELHHVVAHGAVRYWTTKRAGCDETFSLDTTLATQSLLDNTTTPEEFMRQASLLAGLHFSAAQQLIPRIRAGKNHHHPSYTFVTGDGGGHPSARRSAMGEINSHHVWGLAAALRQELQQQEPQPMVVCRELRIGLTVHPVESSSSSRPLSEDIGELCAGMVAMTKGDSGRLVRIDTQHDLESMLKHYQADGDKTIGPLPSFAEFVGSM
jgi:NAD(P)-dependent dehydrogenase (short-subunit alcohol dehydrogenase family)